MNDCGIVKIQRHGIMNINKNCVTRNPDDIMIKFTAPQNRVIRSNTRKVTDNLDEIAVQISALISVNPAYPSITIAEKIIIEQKTISQRLKFLKKRELLSTFGRTERVIEKVTVNKNITQIY